MVHNKSIIIAIHHIAYTKARQPGEPVDKQTLAQAALGRPLTLYDRSLDMHVSNLRRKLGQHANGQPRIIGLRGRGYYYAP